MASTSSSSSSSLAWYWVLEALADMKQIDPPLLKSLVSNLPVLFEEAPESVKERLALRYLEACSNRGVVGTKNMTGTIENVLCKNLTKVVDLSKPVQNKNEIINNELKKFISNKRSTLPKLSLDLVKESALKGEIPKLLTINEDNISLNQGQECNNTHDGIDILQKDPSDNNNNTILQKDPCDTNNENDLVNEVLIETNLEINENIEPSSDDTNNFIFQKRLPIVPKISLQALKETILESNIPNLPSINENNNNNEPEIVNLQKDPSISENLSDARTISEDPNIISQNNNPIQNIQNPNPNLGNPNKNIQTSNPNLDNPDKNIQNPNPNLDNRNKNVQNSNPNLGNSSKNIQISNPNFVNPNIVPETSSETNDLLHDPFEGEKTRLTQITEQNMCIKCDKGGELLNCTNEDCIISVHEACLGGNVVNNFDKNGCFYCPFCNYSRAARVYNKGKKDFLLARKQLSLFLSKDKENGGVIDKGKKVISTEEGDNNNNNNNLRDDKLEEYRYVKSKGRIEDSESGSRDEERENEERENNSRERERSEERKNNRRERERSEEERENNRKERERSEERENERREKEIREEREKKRRVGGEKKDGGERENNKRRRATPRYANPVATPGRRNKLIWSSEEEEALREGMQKFGAPHDGKIPWRDILEYRRHVFDKTRLPGDLKDKWRNIIKKQGSTSGQS